MIETVQTIAVLGGNQIGKGIALECAKADFPVRLYEPDSSRHASVSQSIRASYKQMDYSTESLYNIAIVEHVEEAVDGADLAIDTLDDILELKRSIMARACAVADERTILATHTNSLLLDDIARHQSRASQIISTHWWNPPHLIDVVELAPSPWTEGLFLERCFIFLAGLGKQPVMLHKAVTGALSTRLQHALWREALALIYHGVCAPDAIDQVVKKGLSMTWPIVGPMEAIDLKSIPKVKAEQANLLPSLDRSSTPSQALVDALNQGHTGIERGQGFKRWREQQAHDLEERLIRYLLRQRLTELNQA